MRILLSCKNSILQFTLINCISNALALHLAAVRRGWLAVSGVAGGAGITFGFCGCTAECKQANSLAKGWNTKTNYRMGCAPTKKRVAEVESVSSWNCWWTFSISYAFDHLHSMCKHITHIPSGAAWARWDWGPWAPIKCNFCRCWTNTLKQFYALCVPWLHEKQIEDEVATHPAGGLAVAQTVRVTPEVKHWPQRAPITGEKKLSVKSLGHSSLELQLTQKSIGAISGTIYIKVGGCRELGWAQSHWKPDFYRHCRSQLSN